MPDLVQVEAVFVIAGVQGGIVVQLILERRLHPRIRRLRAQHIRILAGEGGAAQAGRDPLCQNGTGGHAVEQQADAHRQSGNDADALFVPPDEIRALFHLLRRRFCGSLYRCGGALAGTDRSGVLLPDGPLLMPAGEGVAGELGVVLEVLLIQGVHIGLFQLPLRFRRFPVGL